MIHLIHKYKKKGIKFGISYSYYDDISRYRSITKEENIDELKKEIKNSGAADVRKEMIIKKQCIICGKTKEKIVDYDVYKFSQ